MKVAVLLLTCGRPEMTKRVWPYNFANAGYPFELLWFDNGSSEEDLDAIDALIQCFNFEWAYMSPVNLGISIAFNRMMYQAFDVMGYDAVMTVANDILEPDNWLFHRVNAALGIDNTGVVAIPLQGALMYSNKTENNIPINEGGQLIGNWLITRKAYDEVGVFCTDYGNYGPIDLDYCDRLKAEGLRYYYLQGPRADHLGAAPNNPEEYQRSKDNSLKASWQRYTINREHYMAKKYLYQFDLGYVVSEPGG